MLAILYARFGQVNSDLANVDKQFDREFAQVQDEMEKVTEAWRLTEISAQAVHDSREEYHRLASLARWWDLLTSGRIRNLLRPVINPERAT